MDTAHIIATIFAVTFALSVYLMPSLVAISRKHRNSGAIFVLNLLLGWSVLGWIAAIVWAFTSQEPQDRVVYVMPPERGEQPRG